MNRLRTFCWLFLVGIAGAAHAQNADQALRPAWLQMDQVTQFVADVNGPDFQQRLTEAATSEDPQSRDQAMRC